MNVFARRTAVGLAAAATLTLAACSTGATTSSGSTSTPATSTAGSTSTSGGMTSGGMTSGGMTSAAMSSGATSSVHNGPDLMFTQQMIVHHQGAIEMADLAPTRAASQQVKDLAVKIKAAQGPEIEQMTSWLQAWGTDAGTDMNGMPNPTNSSAAAGGMDGSDTATRSEAMSSQMPGMMSADETSQLTAATGAAFDKMFLQMMITHHQGAVEMADTEIAQGSNPDALTLAQSIKTSQTAEITTMQQLLQTL
jgi:uncharacterized protein (DUF305 family)